CRDLHIGPFREHPAGDRCRQNEENYHCRIHRQDGGRDGVALRHLSARTVGFDAAYPTDPHNRGTHHMWPRRGAPVSPWVTCGLAAELMWNDSAGGDLVRRPREPARRAGGEDAETVAAGRRHPVSRRITV